jgi:hypothetical protein
MKEVTPIRHTHTHKSSNPIVQILLEQMTSDEQIPEIALFEEMLLRQA